jgi:hypothetical protein
MTLPYGPEPHHWDAFNAAESPVVDEFTVLDRVTPIILRIQSQDAIVLAAVELYEASTAGIDHDSDIWFDIQGRLFDAVRNLRGETVRPRVEVFDIPGRAS